MSLRLTDYYVAMPGVPLPPVNESLLLDYVVGSNGTFARGRRPGLEVCMPVSFNLQPLRGLVPVTSYVQWGYPQVPIALVQAMLAVSREVCNSTPREALFHLSFDPVESGAGHLVCQEGWHLEYPDQQATIDRVVPVATGLGSSTARAVIELHSHHQMDPDFSLEDNLDESQGFRIYAVIGNIFNAPAIRVRVGLFGHFFQYSASEFFELPAELNDCVAA